MKSSMTYALANSSQIEADLGAQVQQVRVAQNISQETLAGKAGVSERTIRRLEAGKGVSLDTFIRVLSALGIEENLKVLFPDVSIRPVERVRLGKERVRSRSRRPADGPAKSPWQWKEP